MQRARDVQLCSSTMPARKSPRSKNSYEIRLNPARRAVISAAWREADGSGRATAEALDLSPSTLYREIARAWSGVSAAQIAEDLPGFRG